MFMIYRENISDTFHSDLTTTDWRRYILSVKDNAVSAFLVKTMGSYTKQS
jgi:hypothetical protein